MAIQITPDPIDELYQAYLDKVYQHTKTVFNYSNDVQQQWQKNQVCITYGELLYFGVKKILTHLNPTSDDIFLDLGSGLGKCISQVFMQSAIKQVIGIEASTELHIQSQKTIEQIKTDFPFYWEGDRQLLLQCDNFLNVNWDNASIIYTCSTCFTNELLIAIGDKINLSSKIKQVMSLRPLPTLTKLPLKNVFRVECSWDSALCYHYA